MLDQIDPTKGAVLELAKAQDVLSQSLKDGLITTEQQSGYLEALSRYYKDIIDPLGKVNADLDKQTSLLGLNSKEREVQNQLNNITEDLLKQNIVLNNEETLSLKNKLTAYQQLGEVVAQQDTLLTNSVQKRRDFAVQLEAINNLLTDAKSGFTQGDAATATSDLLKNMGIDTTTLQVQATAYVAIYADMYTKIDQLRQAGLISEADAAQARMQIWQQQQASQLKTAQTFFGNLQGLQSSHSKKIAAIGKAAAIAQALIETYKSATSAYSAMASIPYVGPALGIAAAAGAVALGLKNVAQIRAQNTSGYMSGGYTGNAPTNSVAGVVHGQEFVMNAAATRRLGAGNLQALQDGRLPQVPTTSAPVATQASAGIMPIMVNIVNKIPDASFTVNQLDERSMEIIAERVVKQKSDEIVAQNISNPSSKTSRSFAKNTKVTRNL